MESLMASAAARHRREMRANTAAVWLEVGLARHAAQVDRAAERTATRAAEALRLAERYARRWLAAVAERKATRNAPATGTSGSGTSSSYCSPGRVATAYHLNYHLTPYAPQTPAEGSSAPFPPGGGTPGRPSGALSYSPGGLAYTHGSGAVGSQSAAPASRTPIHLAAATRPAASLPVSKSAERDWEGFISPHTTRRAPRPLPKFDATDAILLRLPFGAPSPPPATLAEPMPRAVPPPEPLTELINWQHGQGKLRSKPPAPPPPPAAMTPTAAVNPAVEAAALDGASEGDEGGVKREVREIETGLRGYAELKKRHAANERLRERLVAQADGLPPSQRPALLEATRQLQAAIDEYTSPAAAAARQAAVGRLALRIVELQNIDGEGDTLEPVAAGAHPEARECHRMPVASCGQAW